MYECPKCAGNLKFDIVRQQMYCEYCGTQVDPYSFYKENDAEETGSPPGEYEVTVFICPQCGGEIVSEDTTAATFCSFCGASTILDSRIRKERRPARIIPFTRTKEDCRAAYEKMLRRAVFAPKELRDRTLIEKFRGIYMPYWVYSFEKKGPVSFPGRKTRRRGDYLITEHYRLECELEEVYEGLSYDASSAFSDSLSGAIAPFDLSEGKAFVPSFLSGFYADTSDVDKYVYQSEAEEMVLQDAVGRLSGDPLCRKYNAGQGNEEYVLRNALRPSGKKTELAMLPVWFLACRSGERVSYAVVNGQTGKAAADLPVDEKRYLAGSFLLAIPLFLVLNLFLTITPGKILLIAALLAFLCILISDGQLTRIMARESGEDDKGLASVRPASRAEVWGKKRKRRIHFPWDSSMGKVFLMILLFYGTASLPGFFFQVMNSVEGRGWMAEHKVLLFAAIMLPVGFVIYGLFSVPNGVRRGRSLSEKKPFGGGHFREKWPVLRKPAAGIVLAAIILFVNPVSDWFYYAGAFACMGTTLWAIIDIIRQHNMLTTRKLPQLNRRGGDEYEGTR